MPGTYEDLLRQQTQVPTAFSFSFANREGSVIERNVMREGITLEDGVPIARPLMDLMLEILACQGQARIEVCTTLTCDLATVREWMAVNPPANGWRGLRLIPLHSGERWSLLVANWRGPDSVLYVATPIPFVRYTDYWARNSVILDPLPRAPDGGPTSIGELEQPTESQRVSFHPTIVSDLPTGPGHQLTFLPVWQRRVLAIRLQRPGLHMAHTRPSASQ